MNYRLRITAKRGFDILVALTLLVPTIPIIAMLGVAIWLDDGGPIFFSQERVGLHGRRFDIWKLRTMKLQVTSCQAERITRTGHVLRRLKLDELPQLWNVLAGHMSIVGHRPFVPHEDPGVLAQLTDLYSNPEFWRWQSRPGMTGLAQWSHRPNPPVDDLPFDLLYVSQRPSILLDLWIIAWTIPCLAVHAAKATNDLIPNQPDTLVHEFVILGP